MAPSRSASHVLREIRARRMRSRVARNSAPVATLPTPREASMWPLMSQGKKNVGNDAALGPEIRSLPTTAPVSAGREMRLRHREDPKAEERRGEGISCFPVAS
ncbi:hypothetical protein MRX96_009463 [Rhipicephalus microplus]